MNRQEYLNQPDVNKFINWLATQLPTLPMHFVFSKSPKYVPNGINTQLIGISAAQSQYQWGGDWDSVSKVLTTLREQINDAVRSGDDQLTYNVSRAILRWGGVDNRPTIDFLDNLRSQNKLAAYFLQVESLLRLDSANRLSDITSLSVPAFNSGLTKIHALLDKTGSPIYDGRVGAAISTLYHLYRIDLESSSESVPADHSRFAFDEGQGCQVRDPKLLGAQFKGTPKLNRKKPMEWARRQLQLGWIMREVLERAPELFGHVKEISERCHHFEAGLFMMGYDLRALIPDAWLQPEPLSLTKKRLRTRTFAAKKRTK
ncbi:MAG: hypothetical protein K2Y13_10170 [Burkholderiaceae bacterium]|nr:hypothetical protein [Burkholderiaceae bacterium]